MSVDGAQSTQARMVKRSQCVVWIEYSTHCRAGHLVLVICSTEGQMHNKRHPIVRSDSKTFVVRQWPKWSSFREVPLHRALFVIKKCMFIAALER